MENKFVILLTATIDPGLFSIDSSRYDPTVRLGDYEKALKYWGQLRDSRIAGIVFCENSGASLAGLEKLCGNLYNSVEFIGFSGNEKPGFVHYGYNELGIIDFAILHSKTISQNKYFIKVSGRLSCLNISAILDCLPSDFDAMVDHRKKYRRESGVGFRARTEVMIFKVDFYRDNIYQTRSQMLGNCSHIEEFLAQKLLKYSPSMVIRRFPLECVVNGVSGAFGSSYFSFFRKIKRLIRSIIRRFFPMYWI